MKHNRTIIIILGLLLLAGVSIALFFSLRTPSFFPTERAAISKPAPGFTLKTFSGQTLTLGQFAGNKPVVINFWASWCPPCRDEAPTLAKVSKIYAGKVEFIGIVINDTPANALNFMKEFGITYENGLDQDDIALRYRITGIPETYFIDKQGRLVDHWIGAIDEANLASRTERLMR